MLNKSLVDAARSRSPSNEHGHQSTEEIGEKRSATINFGMADTCMRESDTVLFY